MVTYKLLLDERRVRKDQTFPLIVRVTFERTVSTYQTGIFLQTENWDKTTLQVKKGVPNALALTTKALQFYSNVQKAILKLDSDSKFTLEALKAILYPELVEIPKPMTFKAFAGNVMQDMIKAKRTGGALVYLTAVNRLLDYCNHSELLFSQIDYTLLDSFKTKLVEQGLKPNSIGNYFRTIRALFNKAIKAKIVSRDLYPFHDIPIKTEKTAKRAIDISALIKLYQLPKEEQSSEWHAANFFFLSFTLRGMSFTDMAYLKSSNIQNGYLTYRRRKTHKLYNIKLDPLALQILDIYQSPESPYLLPIFPVNVIEDSFDAKKITRQWIKTTNKYLNQIAGACKVTNHITTYVIRHTWATTAKILGYSNEMIAEALGHEHGNKITNIYLDSFDQNLIDEMNEKVISTIK